MLIGEVAAAADTTTKTLRFYEQAGLLQEAERTAAGYRRYDPDVVERIHFIRRGQAAGLTLAQIRTILEIRDAGRAPCAHVEKLLADRLDEIDRQIAELRELRATVAALHRAATEAEPDRCAPETICRYL
ncbi:MAG: MerR family DNA-binding protein [Actinomycetales bacterium]